MPDTIAFDELPGWVKEPVRAWRPEDYSTWVFEPVPALGDRSVVTMYNMGEEGRAELRRYLLRLVERFMGGRSANPSLPPDAASHVSED